MLNIRYSRLPAAIIHESDFITSSAPPYIINME
jgi:hypothetical protein